MTQVGNVGTARIYITALKGANINESDWREATEAEKKDYEEEEAKRAEEENNKGELE